MTVAFVKKSTRVAFGGGSSAAPSLASVGAGNLVLLYVGLSRGDTANTAISPPSGWTAAQNPAGPSIGGSPNYTPVVGIYYKLSSAGGTESATVAGPAGTYGWAQIAEFSGGPFTFSSAQSASAVFNTGATSRATGTTGANSIADAVVIAIGHPEDTIGNTSALATPAGWISLDLEATNSVENAWSVAYKILSSTGTQSATHSWTTSSYYAGAIAIFEGPAPAGGVTGAGQIASGEAIGSPSIGAGVNGGSVASAQALGAPVVGAAVSGGGGIASAEAIGAPSLGAGISAAGISSSEAIGSPALSAVINGAGGITSGEAFGLPVVAPAGIIAAGIASAEAFGSPAAGAGIAAAGVATAEAAGAPAVGAAIGSAGGIASGETVGQPTVVTAGVIGAGGIASDETFGQPTVMASIVGAGGIVSQEGVGSPLVGAAPPPVDRNAGSEIVGRRLPERNFKPLLQRVLERRYPRVKPAKERAQRRAKVIEQQAAKLVADDPQNLARFDALMRDWMAERPVAPPGLDLSALFEAQVGFRLRQLQLEQQARQALAAAQARDEEDALAVILLLS